jgi:hypothetical protein
MAFVPLTGGDPVPPTPSTSPGGDYSSGTSTGSDPTSSSSNGGSYSGGGTNPYLPVGSPVPTTSGSSSKSSGGSHTGSSSGSTSTGGRHSSSGSGSTTSCAGSSSTTTRTKIVTTTLVPHPVKVKWTSTNATGNGPAPLGFIATAGITSHHRRRYSPPALHVPPHRRTT